jgi:uncharacterized protein (DUF1778 family)
MTAKDARLDIKTTKAAKATLEQAASILGTTLSAFLLDSGITRARKVIAQSQIIHLNQKEAERFVVALEKPPKATEKLKQLFKKHGTKKHNQREKV